MKACLVRRVPGDSREPRDFLDLREGQDFLVWMDYQETGVPPAETAPPAQRASRERWVTSSSPHQWKGPLVLREIPARQEDGAWMDQRDHRDQGETKDRSDLMDQRERWETGALTAWMACRAVRVPRALRAAREMCLGA